MCIRDSHIAFLSLGCKKGDEVLVPSLTPVMCANAIIFTGATASVRGADGFSAFSGAKHAKRSLAQSMARELMPQGIHVVHVPIDAAIGWTQEDGIRRHRLAGESENDNMADPDKIAETYLHLHRQHKSTWTFEAIIRPWTETW